MADNDLPNASPEADDRQDTQPTRAKAPAAELLPDERIENLAIDEEMRESYLTYAMSTIMDRALPDVRDGLKPSQRRVMVAMNDLHLGPRSKHRKCAKIAGDTSGNYHPHGEGVVYPTLVRLGQEWNMRYRLVDPQGNFGSIDGDPFAAMRYTEARMTAPSMEMMEDLQLDTVDTQANYDGQLQEPTVLPAKFPNLLVNGSQGIAVGMATSIPPHNLGEICDALLHLIDNPDATVNDLLKFVKGPDFPTGGLICGREGIVKGYQTGRSRLTVRGRLHSEQTRGGKTQIVITEIPYQVLKTTIIERIADAVRADRIPNIQTVEDHSDRTGMRIVVELRRGAETDVVVNQLYQYTPLQSTFSMINIALVNRSPQTLTLRGLLTGYLDHRKEVIRRRTAFLLRRARQRAHVLEGLILALADIDRIIELIKGSPDVPTARQRLMDLPLRLTEAATVRQLLPDAFVTRTSSEDQRLTGVQADAILNMQLHRLTGLEIEKVANDYAKLAEEIDGHEAILADEALLMDIVREDVHEMRDKYGDERRTEIVAAADEIDIEDLIAEEDVVVTLSHQGYIKRTPLTTYRRQGRGGQGIIGSESREGDFVERLFVASTHDYMLVFLSSGRMHWLKVYDIPSMARTSRGRAIVNMLDVKGDENICAVVAVRDFDDRFLISATRNGQIKKTELKAYGNPRRGGIQATGLAEDDTVIGVAITSGKDQIVLGTANGQAIRFDESEARPMGRTAAGVRGIHLRDDDHVVGMAIGDPTASLLTLCQHGHGKRTSFDEYRLQSRGGYGIINIKTTERNGKVVGVKSVRDADELMLITSGGMIVRTGVEGVRVIGRATQGVKIISLKKGDELVAIARVVADDQAERPDEVTLTDTPPSDGSADTAGAPDETPADEAPAVEDVAPEAPPAEEATPAGPEAAPAEEAPAEDATPAPKRAKKAKKTKKRKAAPKAQADEEDESDDEDVSLL